MAVAWVADTSPMVGWDVVRGIAVVHDKVDEAVGRG